MVCARRPEKERYRLPEALRPSGPPQLSQSWATRSKQLATVGQTGPGTCSGVGPGGELGCGLKEIQQGVAERQEQDRPPQDDQGRPGGGGTPSEDPAQERRQLPRRGHPEELPAGADQGDQNRDDGRQDGGVAGTS